MPLFALLGHVAEAVIALGPINAKGGNRFSVALPNFLPINAKGGS